MEEVREIEAYTAFFSISTLLYYGDFDPSVHVAVAYTLKDLGIDRQKAIEVGCCERILKDLKKAFDILEEKTEERE